MNITPQHFGLPPKFTSFRCYPSGLTQFDTAADLLAVKTRFTKLYAETGAGKSIIYMLTSLLRGNRVLILTPTVALQKQLLRDFGSIGLVDLRGKSHYKCIALSPSGEYYAGKSGSCAVGVTLCNHGRKCVHRPQCYYFTAADDAKTRNIVQMSYAKWITSDPNVFGKFDTIICDEVQKLPGILESFCTVEIDADWLHSSLCIELPPTNLDTWCQEAADLAELKRSETSDPFGKLLLTKFISGMSRLRYPGVSWVRETTPTGLKFTPVWVDKFTERYIYRGVKNVMLVSATIDDTLLKYLGVDEYTSVNVEGLFSPKRRPIISFSPNGPMPPQMIRKLSHMDEKTLDTWVSQADKIINSRTLRYGYKGLIHSVSYKWAEEIYSRSSMQGLLVTHGKKDAESVIDAFMSSDEPRVLVSPVTGDGRDFKYALARYQLVIKIPLVYMGTPLMQARLSDEPEYHTWLVQHKLTQMFGRLMRVVDDGGETFILDGQWDKWFRRQAKWASWVEAAFQIDHELAPLVKAW